MPDPLPRVVLADEHLLFVLGLERLLESDTEVVRTVGDGRALLTAAEADHPDVVVCDIPMPKLDGLEVTRRLVERNARAKVVILSMYSDAAHVKAAFLAGARAYVLKSSSPDELLAAIHEVLRGRYYSSPAVTEHLVCSLDRPRHPMISPREQEILVLVSRGLGNRPIADSLFISEATVRTHLSHLYAKLGLSNRVQLALYAVESGLGICATPTPSSRSR